MFFAVLVYLSFESVVVGWHSHSMANLVLQWAGDLETNDKADTQ